MSSILHKSYLISSQQLYKENHDCSLFSAKKSVAEIKEFSNFPQLIIGVPLFHIFQFVPTNSIIILNEILLEIFKLCPRSSLPFLF